MPRDLQTLWDDQLKALFNGAVPEHAEWRGEDIPVVLNAIAGDYNHAFLPTGGGLDLNGARSMPGGLLEWTTDENGFEDVVQVCRPKRLVFWNPGNTTRDANFILEVEALDPVAPDHNEHVGIEEEVTELEPGSYEPGYVYHSGQYQGEDLPRGTRLLIRTIKDARYAIFGKGSLYNSYRRGNFDAYNAYHNDKAQFESIVSTMAKVNDK